MREVTEEEIAWDEIIKCVNTNNISRLDMILRRFGWHPRKHNDLIMRHCARNGRLTLMIYLISKGCNPRSERFEALWESIAGLNLRVHFYLLEYLTLREQYKFIKMVFNGVYETARVNTTKHVLPYMRRKIMIAKAKPKKIMLLKSTLKPLSLAIQMIYV
jgi:hypothetical protein